MLHCVSDKHAKSDRQGFEDTMKDANPSKANNDWRPAGSKGAIGKDCESAKSAQPIAELNKNLYDTASYDGGLSQADFLTHCPGSIQALIHVEEIKGTNRSSVQTNAIKSVDPMPW